MAEGQDDTEKTEDPTQKRLDEARTVEAQAIARGMPYGAV